MINETIIQACNLSSYPQVRKFVFFKFFPFTKTSIMYALKLEKLGLSGINLGSSLSCKTINFLRFFFDIESSPAVTLNGIKIYWVLILIFIIVMYILFKPRREKK